MSAAADRLGRLLFIVPYVAHRDGVPLAELADKLGVTPAQIESDLDLLAMVGQPPLTPDHLIDLYVEDDVVYVELDQNLSRPLRLTHDEARALAVACKLVGDLGGLGPKLDALVERLLPLSPVDARQVRELSQRIRLGGADAESPTVAALRTAVDGRREVVVDYYSASSDRKKAYRLQPLALIVHTGVEYLVALDADAERQEKLFRVDRMGDAQATDVAFTRPDELDLEKYRASLFSGRDDQGARVRFAASIARVVRERFAPTDIETRADGSLEVRVSTSSPAWLARWIMPFGADAEVLGPPEARRAIAELCRRAAAAYGAGQEH